MPSLAEARRLTYAICSRAKLNAAESNFKAAFSDLRVCYRFGMHLTGPKCLVDQLLGMAIRSIVTQSGFQILDRANPAPDLLEDFQQQFEILYSKQSCIVDFTAEKLVAYDSIQMIFTDDGKGGGYIRKAELRGMKELFGEDLTEEQEHNLEKLERRQTTELADKVNKYFSQAAHKTPAQLRNEGEDLEKVVEEMTRDNPFLLMLMPAIERVLRISFRGKIETDALITTVALLRYKAKKGQLPSDLQQLVSAGYLKELPIDPFSDAPLVYKQIGDDFILYSFGADFDDDGGTRSKWGEGEKGGDQVFWPAKSKGKSK